MSGPISPARRKKLVRISTGLNEPLVEVPAEVARVVALVRGVPYRISPGGRLICAPSRRRLCVAGVPWQDRPRPTPEALWAASRAWMARKCGAPAVELSCSETVNPLGELGLPAFYSKCVAHWGTGFVFKSVSKPHRTAGLPPELVRLAPLARERAGELRLPPHSLSDRAATRKAAREIQVRFYRQMVFDLSGWLTLRMAGNASDSDSSALACWEEAMTDAFPNGFAKWFRGFVDVHLEQPENVGLIWHVAAVLDAVKTIHPFWVRLFFPAGSSTWPWKAPYAGTKPFSWEEDTYPMPEVTVPAKVIRTIGRYPLPES